jgi:deoxyribonuclease V
MKVEKLHSWELPPKEAVALQRELAGRVIGQTPAGFKPRLVAAADVSSNRFSKRFFAAVVVMSLPGFGIVETQTAEGETSFPYVPGLLSFREIPILEKAFEKVESAPDVVIVDGQGMAHPRRFGLACHVGLLLGLPTIGSAKSLLVGECGDPALKRGAHADIVHNGETIGSALRTREGVKPVYVSIGHLIGLPAARRVVLACAGRARVPEPVRAAHDAANELRRQKTDTE